MIKIIYALFAIIIKDSEICFINTNLFLRKSAICLKLLAQKAETSKQTAFALY